MLRNKEVLLRLDTILSCSHSGVANSCPSSCVPGGLEAASEMMASSSLVTASYSGESSQTWFQSLPFDKEPDTTSIMCSAGLVSSGQGAPYLAK